MWRRVTRHPPVSQVDRVVNGTPGIGVSHTVWVGLGSLFWPNELGFVLTFWPIKLSFVLSRFSKSTKMFIFSILIFFFSKAALFEMSYISLSILVSYNFFII